MSEKVQRGFYLSREQADWLRITAAQRAITQSDLLGELISQASAPAVSLTMTTDWTSTSSPPAPKSANISKKPSVHEVLTKVNRGKA